PVAAPGGLTTTHRLGRPSLVRSGESSASSKPRASTKNPMAASYSLTTMATRPRCIAPAYGSASPGAGLRGAPRSGSVLPCDGTGVRLSPVTPQPQEQQDQRNQHAADAVDEERGIAADVPDQPGEVLPEEPGDERQRQENGGQDSELFDGGVLPEADLGLLDRDHRHIGLEHRAEQVTLRGYLLVDQQQMVIDITQVWLQLLDVGGPFDRG